MAKMKGYKASIEDQIKMRRTLNNLYEEVFNKSKISKKMNPSTP